MGFLYFLPGMNRCTQKGDNFGLDHLNGASIGGSDSSLSGVGSGYIFKFSADDTKLSALEDKVEWKKCNGGKFYLGIPKDFKFEPSMYARKQMMPGYMLDWKRGFKMLLPTAKVLPTYLGIDEDGNDTVKVVDEFKSLCEKAEKVSAIFRAMKKGEEPESDFFPNEDFLIAIKCIQTNYHLGRYELDYLGIPDKGDASLINRCLIDETGSIEDPAAASEGFSKEEVEKKN